MQIPTRADVATTMSQHDWCDAIGDDPWQLSQIYLYNSQWLIYILLLRWRAVSLIIIIAYKYAQSD